MEAAPADIALLALATEPVADEALFSDAVDPPPPPLPAVGVHAGLGVSDLLLEHLKRHLHQLVDPFAAGPAAIEPRLDHLYVTV